MAKKPNSDKFAGTNGTDRYTKIFMKSVDRWLWASCVNKIGFFLQAIIFSLRFKKYITLSTFREIFSKLSDYLLYELVYLQLEKLK